MSGAADAASPFAEAMKYLGGAAFGFGLKWLLGVLSGRAAEARSALALLATTSRNAEAAARTVMAGQPDVSLGAGVQADRVVLGNKLSRALGHRSDYLQVQTAMAVYGRSLACADPMFGEVTEAHIDKMRAAEQALHTATCGVVSSMWSWRLFKHERSS